MARSILKPAYAQAVAAFSAAVSAPSDASPDDTDPAVRIIEWLANLKLLNNVPFRYLVADERMLPEESIRFFYVDMNWVDVLIDGAYSIGRYASTRSSTTSNYNKVEGAAAKLIMKNATKVARTRRSAKTNKINPDVSNHPFEIVTGFLLHSKVVKGWKGIQVNAYAKNNYPDMPNGTWDGSSLRTLRFETLSDDVLLGFFEGETYRLDIHEPSEGLHFGFDTATGDQLSKNLRNTIDGSNSNKSLQPADLTNNKIFRTYTIGSGGGGQVVNLYNLSSLIFTTLTNATVGYTQPPASILINNNATAVASSSSLASSDFALQMVEGVGMVSFYNISENDPVNCTS